MSAPTIEECVLSLELVITGDSSIPLDQLSEILRILRAVKASREELPTRHGGLMACNGCER